METMDQHCCVYQVQKLNGQEVMCLLSLLDWQGRQDRALEVFECLNKHSVSIAQDRYIYSRMMTMFSRSREQAATALKLFERMTQNGVAPDLVAFNSAICAAAKAERLDTAMDIFTEMRASSVSGELPAMMQAMSHAGLNSQKL